MNAADYLLGPAALSRHGMRAALLCQEESLSFAELAARVKAAAAAWRALGAVQGDRVIIVLRDTPEFAAAWLGALYAGVVAIAVSTRLAEDDYRHIFEDSGARLVLAESGPAQSIDTFAPQCRIPLPYWLEFVTTLEPRREPAPVRPEDAAFWLYSSGTTGRPKGVIHAHKDILPAGSGMREVLEIAEGDVVFGTSKLFFAYGLEHSLLGPLSLGASSILHPDPIEAHVAADLVARHRPAAFFSVPSFYRRLLSLAPEALAPFRGVRHCVAAGERLPAQIVSQWQAATGREILSLYGMSETFCAAMITPPGTSAAARTGRPLASVETRLLDDAGKPVGPGEQGVLWLRHPGLSSGYANRPEATRAQFVDGWFCTKDVFVCDSEGFFSHQGREDEFIKVAGQWVQPAELEDAVTSESAIAEAACVRVSDADGFERLALFVAAGADPEAAMRAAASACERNLARHKRPKWIRAVSELPRTATGKLQRFKLRELLERELSGKV